jgi:hypothetical protein
MKAAQLEFANQMSCSAQLNLASKHTDAFSSINTNLHAPRNSKLPTFSIHGSKCHSISKRSLWKEFQEQGGIATRRKSGLSSRAAGTSCCSNEHQITKEDGPQKLPLAARFLKLFSRRKDPITRKSSIIQVSLFIIIDAVLSCLWKCAACLSVSYLMTTPQTRPCFCSLVGVPSCDSERTLTFEA